MKFQRKALAIAVMVATSTLTACGSSSSDPAPEPPVTPVNTAPTAVALSANTVDENAMGVEVGTLSATDANSGDTFVYTTDNANFAISGNTLSLAADASFDFEKMASVELNVTVTDNGGLSHTEALTVNVNDLLDYYDFASKFIDGKSSASYSGQTARHALIAELKHYIGTPLTEGSGLAFDLEQGTLTTKEQVLAKLNSYFNRDENAWDGFAVTFTDAKQKFFSDISSYKSLRDKVAGNDASGQHKLWNDGEFAGWGAKGTFTPTTLIEHFFNQLADNAMENLGGKRYAPGTETEIDVFVNYDGTDLNQLIQKFLLMSVAYSQAADDYLDENKGLATDNVGQDKGTKSYTKLEHQFDEGFGYFGAAKDYLAYNDNEIAGKVKVDGEGGRLDWNSKHDSYGVDEEGNFVAEADGVIDLYSEFNFGNSVNAAKRDRGSATLQDGSVNPAATNYTKQAMEAFLAGRKLINDAAGADLTDAQKEELIGFRNVALDAWERSVVATVVHYINDLRDDLLPLESGEGEFDFAKAAKHFSEMKGFALGLQFNPYSPIAGEDAAKFAKFEQLNTLLKDAPVFEAADVAAYRADLLTARNLLEEAYSFDATNVANW